MKKIIACNWKTNYTSAQIIRISHFNIPKNIQLIVIPPYPYIIESRRLLPDNILLGAQNTSVFENGPYTGEVTSTMLKDCDCNTIIVGHSERRINFHETTDEIRKKIEMCKNVHLDVILCVGEKIDKVNDRFSVIAKQMEVLKYFKGSDFINVAYEPVWAIGSNKIPEISDLQETVSFIRNKVDELVGNGRILYGGSVSSKNIVSLESICDLDGYLIGNASVGEDLFRIFNVVGGNEN